MASNARDQLGVDLPDPQDPESITPPAPEPVDDRPEWLPDNFKSPEEFAASYKSLQEELRQRGVAQKSMEAQLEQLTEAVEGFQARPEPQQQPQGGDDAIRARLQESLESDPIGTIAYLAQQYAAAEYDNRMAAMQQQNNPMLQAQQERDNQLLAMMVDQRLGETIEDWDDYRDKVGQMIVDDQTLIPQEVLMNPEATVNAIRRVYQVVKANDILEQQQNGTFVTTQMKRQAQSMTGAGVRNVDVDPSDEKMDALKNAVIGSSYSAWRGGA